MTNFLHFFRPLNFASKSLLVFWVVYFVGLIIKLSTGDITHHSHQHDFQVYHDAAILFLSGKNPYAPTENIDLAYLYPPATLYPVSLWGYFSYPVAYYFYLSIKVLAFFLFIKLIIDHIRRAKVFFAKDTAVKTIILVVILGFSRALEKDFSVGNITLFESVVVWYALKVLFEHKYKQYIILILLVSTVKLYLILFIFMLIFIENKKLIMTYIPISLAIFLSYLAFNFFALNDYTQLMIANLQAISSRAASSGINASFLGLCWDLNHLKIASFNPYVPYIIMALLFSAHALYVLFYERKIKWCFEDRILFAIITLYVVMPRLQDYSYTILLPLVILLALRLDMKTRIMFLIIVLLPLNILFGWLEGGGKMIFWYQHFFDTVVTYIFYLSYLYKGQPESSKKIV